MYDKYGMEGLKSMAQRGNGEGFGDIFDMFFNGGGGRSRKKQKPQQKPTVVKETISLSEAFNGKVNYANIDRSKICDGCDGKGGENV